MTIHLGRTDSEKNALDKNFYSVLDLTGNLVDSSSVTEPTILIETSENISNYNYMHIPEFNRYFFITDIVSVRNGLWMVKGHCDVLMTYKNGIRNNTASVDRRSTIRQPYIPDARYTFDAYNEYYVQKFGVSLSKSLRYVLAVAGQN